MLTRVMSFILYMSCYTLLELTSPFLPTIQGLLFLITVVWGLLNYRPYCWETQTWLEEIQLTRAPKLNFVHINTMGKLTFSADWWGILSHCILCDRYNVFLLGLLLTDNSRFFTCLFWYGELILHFTYEVFLVMKQEPPDPWQGISKNTLKFMRIMMRQGCKLHSKG